MRDVTCVILAAGISSRYGAEKLTLPFGDGTMLDAVLQACEGFPRVVVTSPRVIEAVVRLQHDDGAAFQVLANHAPSRGMVHSLRLANAAIPAEHAIAVLLGDKPLIRAELLHTLLAHRDEADVVYPVRSGVAGHPVIFSAKARSLIPQLPDGDNIRLLRDDPQLTRCALETDDEGAFADVDTEEDYRDLLR